MTCTGFSHDGVYVATADISGLVIVWKVDSQEVVFTFECSDAEVCISPGIFSSILGTWPIPTELGISAVFC